MSKGVVQGEGVTRVLFSNERSIRVTPKRQKKDPGEVPVWGRME